MSKVSKAQANKVLAAVKAAFPAWDDAPGPTLVMAWEPYWREGGTVTAILWEEGPYEWTQAFTTVAAGFDTVDEEYGGTHRALPARMMPDGVYVEPGNGWALMLYPA